MTNDHNKVPPIRSIIGSLFIFIWLILTLISRGEVLNAYNSTSLPYALLTVDSLFFAGLIAIIAVVISIPRSRETCETTSLLVNNLLTISGSVAILIIANISAYFTTGLLHSIVVYYQIWTLPAAMTLFYHVMP